MTTTFAHRVLAGEGIPPIEILTTALHRRVIYADGSATLHQYRNGKISLAVHNRKCALVQRRIEAAFEGWSSRPMAEYVRPWASFCLPSDVFPPKVDEHGRLAEELI